MKKEFVMRGQTDSGQQEVLNFSGHKKGYAYRLTEFAIYPSTNIGASVSDMCASVTAAKTASDPQNPNFNDEGLIGNARYRGHSSDSYPITYVFNIVNDTFLITQDLILSVLDNGSSAFPVNWQCRFVSEKMKLSQEAVANYNQFTIFDG